MTSLREELREVFLEAWKREFDEEAEGTRAELAGIDAILSALASKGVDGMPSVTVRHNSVGSYVQLGDLVMHEWYTPDRAPDAEAYAEALRGFVRGHFAAIFAAQAAERDALRARVAEPWPFDGETPHDTVARLLRRVAELETELGVAAKAMRDVRESLEADLVDEESV